MEKDLKTREFVKRALIITGAVALLLLLIFVIQQVMQILLVAFAGIVLAVFLDGLSEFITKKVAIPRRAALAIVITAIILVLFAGGWIIGPRIVEQFSGISEKIPEALDSIQNSLKEYEWGRKLLNNIPGMEDVTTFGSEVVWGITGVFSTAFGTIASLFIVLFIGLYGAFDPRLYVNNFLKLIPPSNRERAHSIIDSLGRALRGWLIARFTSMTIVGILTAIGLSIIGVQLALALALIAAILSFIPFIGPLLGAIPALLVALAESPILMLYVGINYLIVESLESYLITPLVFKSALSIPPAFIITIQVVMGTLFGAMGVVMATPLTVVLIVLVQTVYIEDILKDEVKVMGQE
ncbi:MAG: AI-2E family transporter [candidate division Zixibacteria bacterium]|nr:AI-2E family transporter [candidate division Zixibacteria bacterium]